MRSEGAEKVVSQKLASEDHFGPNSANRKAKRGQRATDFAGLILTDVTVLAHPSTKAATVISTNQVFARVSIEARLLRTLINVCKLETRDRENEQESQEPASGAPITKRSFAAHNTTK